MWEDQNLAAYLQKNNTIQVESLVLAEWNMNDFTNVSNYGTYRYRRAYSNSPYFNLNTKYDVNDTGDYYYDAEKSFYVYEDFVQDDDQPLLFQSEDVNRKLYFDLEQCFYPFRPRSGINKLLYFDNKYVDNIKSARRPRYYMSTRYDKFKYWNSYRKQSSDTRGELTYKVFTKQLSNNVATLSIGNYVENTRYNLVSNPSFEVNTVGWSAFNNATLSTSNDQQIFGSYSCKVTTSAVVEGTGIQIDSGYRFKIIAGAHYSISAYVYIPQSSASVSALDIDWFEYDAISSGTATSSQDGSNFSINKGEWTRVSHTFVAAKNGYCSARIGFASAQSAGSRTLYIDSILIEKMYQPLGIETSPINPTPNQTPNSYFDGTVYEGLEPTISQGWDYDANNSSSFVKTYKYDESPVLFNIGDSINVYSVDDLLNGTYTIVSKNNNVITYNVSSGSTINTTTVNGSVSLVNSFEEYGISRIVNPSTYSNSASVTGYYIEDTAPFVVYSDSIPVNRIVTKMQTNLSSVLDSSDPLSDRSVSSIPKRWKIEYLDNNNNWQTAVSFNENSSRFNNAHVVDWDGYVELFYGIKVPFDYRSSFHFVGYADTISNIPMIGANNGEAYIIGLTASSPGTLYIWNSTNNQWYTETASYGFSLYEYDDTKKIGTLSSVTDQRYFLLDENKIYTEFIYIKGLRLSVESMIASDQTFNLIELSPRLKVNMSDYVTTFSVNKSIANDSTQLPVGSLIASTGDVELMNIDDAFTINNEQSLISKYLKPNIKFDFYEIVLNVDGQDKYIPISSFYSEIFPNSVNGMNNITVPLRDQFFRFESMRAPDIFLQNTTLTSAIAILMDHCGFSNYIFKTFDDPKLEEIKVQTSSFPLTTSSVPLPATNDIIYPSYEPPIPEDPGGSPYDNLNTLQERWNKYWQLARDYAFTPVSPLLTNSDYTTFLTSIKDPVIPFFYSKEDFSVAQILMQLASATQTAMFFDEYNNFVIAPKEYILPEDGKRITDLVLYGQKEQVGSTTYLPNIIEISNAETQILNNGVIKYSMKYIQKVPGTLSQYSYNPEDRVYTYKPVLLWEVASNEQSMAVNDENASQSGFTLSAVPLNTYLNDKIPYVENNTLKNNILNIGESAIWLGKFQGYLYANGEIIRYDAIEYSITGIPGNVWITSSREYESYFSKMLFKGKIYRTGNIRIYAKPEYETINGVKRMKNTIDSPMKEHGRGQFGTSITEHHAGLSDYWSSDNNVRGLVMTASYIFGTTPTEDISYPAAGPIDTAIGVDNHLAKSSTRNGIIKNFARKTYPTENIIKTLKSTTSGTIQSSALVFVGPPDIDDRIYNISQIFIDGSKGIITTTEPHTLTKNMKFDIEGLAAPYNVYNAKDLVVTDITSNTITYTNATNISASVVNKSLSGNVATLTTSTNHRINPSQSITVAGVDSTFNGTYTVSSASANIVRYSRNSASVASASATGTIAYLDKSLTISASGGLIRISKDTGKINFVSYVYKKLNGGYKHFGTRMRIVGRYESDSQKVQNANNGSVPLTYYNVEPTNSSEKVNIDGGSGGISIGINPETNHGYFFEICALTGSNIQDYNQIDSTTGEYKKVLHNIIFYKTYNSGGKAIPKKLWGGVGSIIVDEGLLAGQDRIGVQENPTVYDLAVEYKNIGSTRRFYLYINNKEIAIVDDTSPLPEYNNIALFVRGESHCMFEYLYALQNLTSQNTEETIISEINDTFGDDDISTSEIMRKYSLSGFIKATLLNDISSSTGSKYKIYFEEFGTIMRECAYFNIKYDKAYPAMLATLAPTFNSERGYSVSGFKASAYGAEFLIFNTTDRSIVLDETTGNYLRILGVTFTQQTTEELTVDDHFKELSNNYNGNSQDAIETFKDLKLSRKKYGPREFSIESEYIQSYDDAEELMSWMMTKTLRSRLKLTVSAFGVANLQLGDLVTINYKNNDGIKFIDSDKKFIVQSINNSMALDNRTTELVLVEI